MPQAFIKFFGNDWRSDPRLRLCCAASRGVWADMITLMMEAEPFGHLLVNGVPSTPEEIAVLTVTPVRVIKAALKELGERGVYSTTADGVIYSRRMLRDAQRAAEAREHGRRGGNPSLKGHGKTPPDKPWDKGGGYPPSLTGVVKPHGISQKPESQKPPSPPNSAKSEAHDVVYAFWHVREAVFGNPAPSDDRFTARDLSIAQGWIDRSATFDLLRDLFENEMRRMEKRGAPPPQNIWFFNGSVDALIGRAA